MTTFKNVALAGASGNIGLPILKALLAAKEFNVTVLSRQSSTATFPPNVTVAKVDYDSVDSLTHALQGHAVLISTLATLSLASEHKLIDAALAAGVKRYLPSSFGCNLSNPLVRQLPVFAQKVKVEEQLKEVVKTHPNFSYTFVYNSAFLDWGIEKGTLFNYHEFKPEIYDGGDRPFSGNTLATIADAVVGVLRHPEETKNRGVQFQNAVVTQNKFLEIAKRLTPGKEWKPVDVSTKKLKEEADAKLASGKPDDSVWIGYLFNAIFREGYGGQFDPAQLDNELLGVKPISDKEIEDIYRKVLNTKGSL